MTNATKAAIILVVNSGLALLVLFGVPVSDAQAGGISLFINSVLGLYVTLTYKASPLRIDPEADKLRRVPL